MPASEIDDIFASKGKKSSLPVPSTSSSQPPSEKLKIRKKKKSPKQKDQVTNEQPTAEAEKSSKSSATKRRIPETVLDPSAPAKTKGKPNAPSSETSVPKAKKRKLGKDEEERFRDSRGTGPSMFSVMFLLVYLHDTLHFRKEDRGGFCYLQRGRTWYYRHRRRWVFFPYRHK